MPRRILDDTINQLQLAIREDTQGIELVDCPVDLDRTLKLAQLYLLLASAEAAVIASTNIRKDD